MPDTIIPPAPPTTNFSLPDVGPPDLFNNVASANNLPPSGADYAKSIASSENIVDLINQVNSIQDQAEGMLGQYKTPNVSSYDIDDNSITQRLSKQLNPEEQSLQSFAKPMVLGTERDYNRYKDSKDFQSLGYTPNLGEQQEFKYGNAMDWGETVGKAISGGTALATNTFVEGWKGWGRMTSALLNWDSTRLMGTPEEREQIAKEQEDIFNKYAIYDTAESKDGFFNRQFFGNMLQQSGFAVGALAQFAVEEVLTAGIGGAISAASKGLLVARTGKALVKAKEAGQLAEKTTLLGKAAEGVKSITGSIFKPKTITTASETANNVRKAMDVVTSQPKVINGFANGLKKLVPGYGTVEEIVKLNKAGAGFAQMAYTGIGGIKRGLSEFNMARSESIFEAASTYTDLKNKLVEEYYAKTGEYPQGKELERIKQKSEDASHDNFWTNVGVLSVMNRIQFDNMFNSFKRSRSLLGPGTAELKGSAFVVKGVNKLGKQEIKTFAKGPLGDISSIGQVAKTFGTKQAAWVATKSIGKGLMKFEGSEGLQELIQEASNTGLSEYYYDLYHGSKGYDTKLDSVLGSMKNPLTDTQAMKTFLMGALTGRLISPMTGGFTAISENIQDRNKLKKAEASAKTLTEKMMADYKERTGKEAEGDDLESIKVQIKQSTEYQTKKQKVQEAIGLMNSLSSDPTFLMKEAIANIKINNKAAENMEEAAANHNQYIFNNTQGSALAKTVAAAIKLDMYDSLKDMLGEYGQNMTDEEFKSAFNMDASDANKKNVKDLTSKMASNVEDYYNTYKVLKDKYSDLIIPELYKNNDPAVYKNAKFQKFVLDNMIEMIATNSFKAKDAIKRASELQSKIASNKNIGGSAMELLTKMGNEAFLDDHISLLQKELSDFEKTAAGPLSKEQKELLDSKKEELMWAKRLQVSFDGLMGNNDSRINPVLIGEGTELESYSPAAEKRAYEAFSNLLNIFNKRAKINTTVSKEDADEAFIDYSDYVKLNRDHGQFVDAINLLANPRSLEAATQAHISGTISALYNMKKSYMEK